MSGSTVNRLCGSGADAVAIAARSVRAGEADLVVAGGVESMSRAPFVMAKATVGVRPVGRPCTTRTLGWRFVNPAMERRYGIDSMGETAENVAEERSVSRADQDAFALRSQERTAKAQAAGRLAEEIVAGHGAGPTRRASCRVGRRAPAGDDARGAGRAAAGVPAGGTVTAGNSSGVNDGAAALLVASERAVAQYGLTPLARVTGAATAGVPPRVMGLGPVPATRKLLDRVGLGIGDIDVVELNEAFAAQALAVLRELGLPDDADHVNPNGGAIALGHPLGMSGARLALTAALELGHRDARRALATMCIGVGQGISVLLER